MGFLIKLILKEEIDHRIVDNFEYKKCVAIDARDNERSEFLMQNSIKKTQTSFDTYRLIQALGGVMLTLLCPSIEKSN